MKIAIAGYGIEGEANYNYWATDPSNELTIVDESEHPKHPLPTGAHTILGPGVFEKLNGFDMVIRTAGLSPYKIVTDGIIWSATNEFFEKCPALIIGVTGTKGKGTTSSMIASILEAAGKKVWLVGNIGKASLEILSEVKPEDIVVYELSSFQLWDLKRSPQIGVVTVIEPEHLDVHKDYQDYITAKSNISRYQKLDEVTYYNPNNTDSRWIAEAGMRAQQEANPDDEAIMEMVAFATPYISEQGVHIKDGGFYNGEQFICSTDALQLVGAHNQENACAALSVVLDVNGVTNKAIEEGLRNFKGLPHRIEYVRTLEGVDYYNDSFSSSTPAVLAAVASFTRPEIVIIGGVDRGGDFEHLAAELKKATNIKEIILIGDIRTKLAALFSEAGVAVKTTVLDARTMKEIVDFAHKSAQPNDVVILSPGCASFDMFKDFYDRGDQFRKEVNALTKPAGIFSFDDYSFDKVTGVAWFHYSFNDGRKFTESIEFGETRDYDEAVLDKALFLSFVLIGTSYYKTFPSVSTTFRHYLIDKWQATFFDTVYQEGLSQFAFENNLTRKDLAWFVDTANEAEKPLPYKGKGTLSLQSGGKDSLLVATLLARKNEPWTPWYLSSSDYHPDVLDDLGQHLVTTRRVIDHPALWQAGQDGALNGHVPVTYIVQSIALLQAILLDKNEVLVSIANEGQEAHAHIGDLPVMHQWSKTWAAEQAFQQYIIRYISPDIRVGSPLRRLSELRVAELFIQHAWGKFGHRFSSCNRANYTQGADNSELHWCGECPKCANSYLLFAPFMDAEELKGLFAGQDLFTKPLLTETFKGLLDVDGVMKPFECVGETDELRHAYHQAQKKGGYRPLPFDVPAANFDYLAEYPSQDWARL